jgi:hypothetical protein
MVEEWRAQKSLSEDIEFIFEDLGRGQGARTEATKAITPSLPKPSFEANRHVPATEYRPGGKSEVTQLQAAGYLAYECRKAMLDRTKIGSMRHRQSLQAVVQARFHMGGICSNKAMCRFCLDRNIRKRRPPDSAIYASFG